MGKRSWVLAPVLALAACGSGGTADVTPTPSATAPAVAVSTDDDRPTSTLESVGELDRSDVTVRVRELLTELDAVTEVSETVIDIPDTVLFAFDSRELEPSADDVLTDVAELLALLPDEPALVVGHTDDVGDEDYNQELSADRARAVVERLVELGVAPARLEAEGRGESDPAVAGTSDDARAQNRRVQVVLARVDINEGQGR